MANCHNCGQPGHFAQSCPLLTSPPAAQARPEWCGECDRATRLIDRGSEVARCHLCHPLAHRPLAQHRQCGGCGQVVYAWESRPCDEHGGQPQVTRDEHAAQGWAADIREAFGWGGRDEPGGKARNLALEQVAESRRARLADVMPGAADPPQLEDGAAVRP